MAMADDIIGMASQTAQQLGHSGADALQAYHVAATAEHARQELDMEKEKQQMTKATWLTTQIGAINRMSGPAQGLAMDNFEKHAKQLYPGMDPMNIQLLKKDPEMMRGLYVHLNTLLDPTKQAPPEAYEEANKLLEMSSPELGTLLDHKLQANAAYIGAQAKAAPYAEKNKIMGDADARNVAQQYQTAIKSHKNLQEDIGRIESILTTRDKNGKPLVTAQQIGDANMAISRIFSPNHQSDSTMEATEYGSVPIKFAKAIQEFSAHPEDTKSRELVEHMVDQAHAIGNVSNQNALRQLDDLDSYAPNLQNASAHKTATDLSSQLRKRFSVTYPTMGAAAGKHPAYTPGTLLKHKDGTTYKVGSDGQSLEKVNQ